LEQKSVTTWKLCCDKDAVIAVLEDDNNVTCTLVYDHCQATVLGQQWKRLLTTVAMAMDKHAIMDNHATVEES
jgi:hypothetical protein